MKYSIPVVYTLHSVDIPADFLHKKMTYVGDKAIGVSSEASQFLRECLDVPQEKVVTICNGADEKSLMPLTTEEKQKLRGRWELKEAECIFALHSRIAEVKNHLLVVEAVKCLPVQVRGKIKILCSGEKEGQYYEKVISTIHEYGLDEIFVFTGWSETREILGISDALVLPSVKEGFPISVIEAFLLKTPVLRTRTAGFVDQKYCIEILPGDPKRLSDIMEGIITGRQDCKQNVEAAYQYAMEHFTIEKMTEKTLQVYKEVLGEV